jgi:3-dehydroquinate synthase
LREHQLEAFLQLQVARVLERGQRLRLVEVLVAADAAAPAGLDPAALLERMRLVTTAAADGLRFVLWVGPGRARLVAGVPESAVLESLAP